MKNEDENVEMSDEQIIASGLVNKFFYATLIGCSGTLIVLIVIIILLYNLIKWLF